MYEKIVGAGPEAKPSYLDEGDLMHLMLAEYYRQKMLPVADRPPHIEMIDNAIKLGRKRAITMDLSIEAAEDEVISTFQQYCLFYQDDKETPVAVEQPMVLTLYERPDTEDEEGLRVILQLIVDVIFENRQGQRTWTDHKTRRRNREATPLSNQFLAYAWASGDRRSMRNNIGFQKSLAPEKKFTRDFFPYPKSVINWWVEWTVYRAQYIDACVKSENFPPDFTVCDKYDGCFYQDVCMQNLVDRERFLNDNFIQRRKHRSIFDLR
jgi:hypothetical protein